MKLTRTDAVFSRTAMMLFIVQKTKVLGMTYKFTEITFGKYKKYWRKNPRPGGPHPVHEGGGRALPPGRAPCLVGPLTLHRPQLQLHIFRFAEKKIRENVSSRFTIWSRRQSLISLGRANLESVRDSEEGDSSPFVIINHPPSPIS